MIFKKRQDYNYMIPPNNKDIENMSNIEAKEHYDWFIRQTYIRVRLLFEEIEKQTGDKYDFETFTPQMLVSVWTWFIENAKFKSKTILSGNDLEVKWLAIAFDISILFCELMIRSNPNLKWRLNKTKSTDADKNKPVVSGFDCNERFEPSWMIRVQLEKFKDGTSSPEALLDLFNVWCI